jgi:hypothetical protein
MDWPDCVLHPYGSKNALRVMDHQGAIKRTERRRHRSGQGSLFSVLLVVLSLAACGERQDKSKAPIVDEDEVLFKDIQRAVPELERRLMERMSVQDGLILIRDPVVTYVLPANSPWLVRCSFGVSVVFGTAVSSDGSNVENDVKIDLAQAFVTQDNCSVLALQLGRRLKAMLREPTNSP